MSAGENRAVFLSYASQDAAAARRICDALRAAGVEVWFDQNELRGGDAWDAKIRKQIKECALFVPIISAHTQARLEGYFRLEWHLAERRMQHMHEDAPFLLPVVIDDVAQDDAKVPAQFLEVQWMRLPDGETTSAFTARVLGLVRGSPPPPASGSPAAQATSGAAALPRHSRRSGKWLGFAVAAGLVVVAFALWWSLPRGAATGSSPPTPNAKPVAASAPAPVSEARQLAEKARELINGLDATRDDHRFAEQLVRQAVAKDGMDAEVVAVEAQLHTRFMIRGWEDTDARREVARVAVQKALRLDPQSFEARFAEASLLQLIGREAKEKEAKLRVLRAERPGDKRVLRMLGETVERQEGRLDESLPFFDEAAALPGGDPLALYDKSLAFWFDGRTTEADTALQASLAQQPFIGARLIGGWYALVLHGDVPGARALLDQVPAQALREDRAGFFAFSAEYWGRSWAAARARLNDVPRDWLNDSWYRGPKGLLIGDAYRGEGRLDAARLEWQTALKLVEERRAASPNNRLLIYLRIELLARLGEREAAEREAKLIEEATGVNFSGDKPVQNWVSRVCLGLGRHADVIRQISLSLKQRRRAVDHTSWELKLNPDWDALRGNPDFAAVIAEAEKIEQAETAPKKTGEAPRSN